MSASGYLVNGQGMGPPSLDVLVDVGELLGERPGPFVVGADTQASPEGVCAAGTENCYTASHSPPSAHALVGRLGAAGTVASTCLSCPRV